MRLSNASVTSEHVDGLGAPARDGRGPSARSGVGRAVRILGSRASEDERARRVALGACRCVTAGPATRRGGTGQATRGAPPPMCAGTRHRHDRQYTRRRAQVTYTLAPRERPASSGRRGRHGRRWGGAGPPRRVACGRVGEHGMRAYECEHGPRTGLGRHDVMRACACVLYVLGSESLSGVPLQTGPEGRGVSSGGCIKTKRAKKKLGMLHFSGHSPAPPRAARWALHWSGART